MEDSSTLCACTTLPELVDGYCNTVGNGAFVGFKEYTDKDFVDGLVDSGHGLDCDRLHTSYVKFIDDGDPLSILSVGRSTSLGAPYVDMPWTCARRWCRRRRAVRARSCCVRWRASRCT